MCLSLVMYNQASNHFCNFRYLTDVLNMLQPIYVFTIFVLKRNVIDVIMGRDGKKKKKGMTKSAKTKQTNLTRTNLAKKSIIKSKQQKGYEDPNESNPAFSITFEKETDSSVVLMSAKPYEEIPLTIPSPENNTK